MHFAKLKSFSIAKITFLWRGLKFKRGHGPPDPNPISAMARGMYSHDRWLTVFKASNLQVATRSESYTYLTDQKQQVILNGSKSPLSGVAI